MNTAKLHKKVMEEFGIDERSYNLQCFEGCYLYEIVEFVQKELKDLDEDYNTEDINGNKGYAFGFHLQKQGDGKDE